MINVILYSQTEETYPFNYIKKRMDTIIIIITIGNKNVLTYSYIRNDVEVSTLSFELSSCLC